MKQKLPKITERPTQTMSTHRSHFSSEIDVYLSHHRDTLQKCQKLIQRGKSPTEFLINMTNENVKRVREIIKMYFNNGVTYLGRDRVEVIRMDGSSTFIIDTKGLPVFVEDVPLRNEVLTYIANENKLTTK